MQENQVVHPDCIVSVYPDHHKSFWVLIPPPIFVSINGGLRENGSYLKASGFRTNLPANEYYCSRNMASRLVLLVLSTTFILASVAASPFRVAWRSNVTLTGPALAPEAFKRAVSAPYVFSAFTDASESNLYVYTSADGTNFSLRKGPAYTPPTGLIRDPSIILHTE